MIEKASEFGASAAMPLIPDGSDLSAGDMLRRAREAHGLPLDRVAAALKVPVQKLAALENDDIDQLPDAVFARALAASVARALRIDPAPVLAKLPGATKPGLADADRTLSSKFSGGSGPSGSGAAWKPSRALVAGVLVILAAAAALFLLPQSALDRFTAALRAPGQSETSGGPPGGVSEPASSGGEPAAPVASVEPTAPVPSPTAAASTAAGSAMVAAASLPVATAPGAAAPGVPPLSFTAREDAWITVTDGRGTVLLKRIVKSGESVDVAGNPPMTAVVGRASGVEVKVRGKPFDLKPVTKGGGVARFEVQP